MPPADPKLHLLVRHSAAPKDVALAEELLGHLRPLERFAGLDVWSEARIRAGDETRREIQRAIQDSDVALLLLSSDFFASDGLVEVEVPLLLERHRAGQLRVIPVLLRSCLWEVHPWLAGLDPLPKDREPIASRQGDARDRVLTELAKEVVGLAAPATGSTTAERDQELAPAPASTKAGGDTFVTNIIGGTVSALAVGPGSQARDSHDHHARTEELLRARLQAESAVLPFICEVGGGFALEDKMPVIGCAVENHGEKPFRITSARARWRPRGTDQDNPAEVRVPQRTVTPDGKVNINVKLLMTVSQLSEFDVRYRREPPESPVEAELTVNCENAAGHKREATQTVEWPLSARPQITMRVLR